MKKVERVEVRKLAAVKQFTSTIQDAKRAAIAGKPSRWPNQMEAEFAQLEEFSSEIPYVDLDLAYLRDTTSANRSFGYVLTYDMFLAPPRDASGGPSGQAPKLGSVIKLGDGGREKGRSAGRASGSIISRIVRSYWEEENTYSPVLHGVVIPGNDSGISRKIAKRVGGLDLQIRGDIWNIRLLDRLSVDELLTLLEATPHH